MRWRGNRKSSNVEDRRSMRVSGSRGVGGILQLLPTVVRFLGIKGSALLAVVVLTYTMFTGNTANLLSALGIQQDETGATTNQPLQQSAEEKDLVQFISVILADTEETWHKLFQNKNLVYREPKLVLFRKTVKSACGMAQSAMGPFYCPGDQKVYIDLNFYSELKTRFKAPGDFAQAYVLAHEIGHHVQTLLGISADVHKARNTVGKIEGNSLSVKQELQADCFAGVWANNANRARQLLEAGDVEEGLTAASAIGDDTLQRQSSGRVTPDSFTHGSSKQRVQWFKVGLNSGEMDSCNTFAATDVLRDSSVTNSPGAQTSQIAVAFHNRLSDVQVMGNGIVKRVLPDDNKGSRHQKFILKLAGGQSLLVAHNIDIAARIPQLDVGERVEFNGEYIWNEQGGILHWTHRATSGGHLNGWLKHRGKVYR